MLETNWKNVTERPRKGFRNSQRHNACDWKKKKASVRKNAGDGKRKNAGDRDTDGGKRKLLGEREREGERLSPLCGRRGKQPQFLRGCLWERRVGCPVSPPPPPPTWSADAAGGLQISSVPEESRSVHCGTVQTTHRLLRVQEEMVCTLKTYLFI